MKTSLLPSLATGGLLAAACFLDGLLESLPPALALGPPIDVMLRDHGGRVGADGPWRLVRGLETLAAGRGPVDLRLRVRASHLVANGVDLGPGPFRLETLDGTIRAGERRYRGALLLEVHEGAIQVHNVVSLEDYVASVVGAELPARFSLATLEAQAVVSRTYALAARARGRPLFDDARSQVYAGLSSENGAARTAALATRGFVLETDEGGLFPAYFHSTCGGHTSTPHDVFDDPPRVPPLRGVADPFCADSPHAQWRRTLTESDLRRLVGRESGSLRLVVTRRDEGGRVLECEVRDASGALVDRLRGEHLRVRLRTAEGRLPSCMFEMRDVGPGSVLLRGRGLGHGVGMCQWGAEGMAREGASWRTILLRFYPGTRIAPAASYWSK